MNDYGTCHTLNEPTSVCTMFYVLKMRADRIQKKKINKIQANRAQIKVR